MNNKDIINKLYLEITKKYCDLSSPDYALVDHETYPEEHAEIYSKLLKYYNVTNITDSNVDVSCVYELSGNNIDATMYLSHVGLYCAILYGNTDSIHPCVSGNNYTKDNYPELYDILNSYNVTILERSILEHQIQMKMNYADAGMVTIFHALFSDLDVLPWIVKN